MSSSTWLPLVVSFTAPLKSKFHAPVYVSARHTGKRPHNVAALPVLNDLPRNSVNPSSESLAKRSRAGTLRNLRRWLAAAHKSAPTSAGLHGLRGKTSALRDPTHLTSLSLSPPEPADAVQGSGFLGST